MSDPLSPQEVYAARGLAYGVLNMKRSVKIAGVTYFGVRTDLDVQPGDAGPGGFKKDRTFSIVIPRTAMATDPADGAHAQDDRGGRYLLVQVKSDNIQVTCFFGPTNR